MTQSNNDITVGDRVVCVDLNDTPEPTPLVLGNEYVVKSNAVPRVVTLNEVDGIFKKSRFKKVETN